MGIANAFQKVGETIRKLESSGYTILEVAEGELISDDAITVELSVELPSLATIADQTGVSFVGTGTDDGTVSTTVTLRVPIEPDENPEPVTTTKPQSESNSSKNTHRADGSGVAVTAGSELSLPPHRNPNRLREVYEENDTFAEMTEALGVDVTPQTVRHHMIQHGIHEPSSHSLSRESGARDQVREKEEYDGSTEDGDETGDSDGTDEPSTAVDPAEPPEEEPGDAERDVELEEEVEAESEGGDEDGTPTDEEELEDDIGSIEDLDLDDLELPAAVSGAEFVEAVRTSRTFYEVQRSLGWTHEQTRETLAEFNLLDLVSGRLSNKPNQDRPLNELRRDERSAEEIKQRIGAAISQESVA